MTESSQSTSPKTPPAIIEACGLTKAFEAQTACAQVSFTVHAGEIVGLLGPNGAGKTTLLRMLAGLIAPTEGAARICGFDLSTDPLEARAQLGFTSGGTGLSPRLTARELLDCFAALYGLSRSERQQNIARSAERFDLTAFLDQRISTLSSGQRQRLQLARCFIHHPRALILDEPTATLDVIASEGLHRQLRQARDEGCAVLFSTHILSEAETLCDRLVLLLNGRVLDEGKPGELCERHQAAHLTELFLKAAAQAKQAPEVE